MTARASGQGRIPVSDASVRGVLCLRDGKSGFALGTLIVSRVGSDEEFVRVKRYEKEVAVGPSISGGDWQRLLASGQAMQWPQQCDASLSAGAVVWLLRSTLRSRDTAIQLLRNYGVLRSNLYPIDDSKDLFCLVDGTSESSNELRGRWEAEARARAIEALGLGRLDDALREAKLSHAIAPSFTPESIAIWSLAELRQPGEKAAHKAEGVLKYAENSRGAELREQALALRGAYEAQGTGPKEFESLERALGIGKLRPTSMRLSQVA